MEQERELRRLMDRGRLIVNSQNRDDIAAVMAPLPPPWEWEHLRQVADLSIMDMTRLAKVEHGRIRRWEKGMGTADPGLWLEYAASLLSAVTSELRAKDDESLIRHRENGTINIQMSPGVERQLEMLHSASLSLSMWAEGNGNGPVCSPAEASAVNRALRDAIHVMRLVQGRLRAVRTGTGEQQ